jgi:YbbR domain-containing protein
MPDKDMYIVDTKKAELDTTRVQIAGPKSVIEQIDKATINVDLTGQTEEFMVKDRITLRDKDGNPVDASLVTTNVEEVKLTLPIRYFKYIPLRPENVIEGGGATQESSSILYTPASIMVSGSKEVLSKMTSVEVGVIDLGKLTQAVELTFPILLADGLTCESGETEATVKVSFPNLGTQELTVTNIQALNVPEGLECEIMAKEQKVTVRGPKDVVARVKPTDLTVTIDFSNAVAGTETYTPVITVDQTKCPGVGVIGEYSISATLQDAAAAQTADATTPG